MSSEPGTFDASTNSYPIWIGLTSALVMVCVAQNPAWWMILVLGIGANGVVIAANGWRMPVRGSMVQTVRHTPMLINTRWKWLADIIPTGFGKASIGDFLIAAGTLGGYVTRDHFNDGKLIAVLCLAWWASGWSGGFRLFKKWTSEARRDAKKNIPIVLFLVLVGNLVNVRGCGFGELRAQAESIQTAMAFMPSLKPKLEPQSKLRDLGKLVPPPQQLLRRLRKIEELDKLKRKQEEEKEQFATFTFPSITKIGLRQGPFCRVTCSFHHGENYSSHTGDVEVAAEYCQKNKLSEDAQFIPGWRPVNDKYEVQNPWPGPAQGGLDSYKLYWKEGSR